MINWPPVTHRFAYSDILSWGCVSTKQVVCCPKCIRDTKASARILDLDSDIDRIGIEIECTGCGTVAMGCTLDLFNKMTGGVDGVTTTQTTIPFPATRTSRIREGPAGTMRKGDGVPVLGRGDPREAKKKKKKQKQMEKKAAGKQKKNVGRKRSRQQAQEIDDAGGYTKVGRVAFREEYGVDAVVTGDEKTCLPDALVSACAALGIGLADAYTILHDDRDPNIHEAKALLASHDVELQHCGHVMKTKGGPAVNTLQILHGVFLIHVRIHLRGAIDNHYIVFNATSRHLIDNDKNKKVLLLDDEDIRSSKDAQDVFQYFFPGADAVRIYSVHEVRRADGMPSIAELRQEPRNLRHELQEWDEHDAATAAQLEKERILVGAPTLAEMLATPGPLFPATFPILA